MLRSLSKYDPYAAMTADDIIARYPVLRQDHGHHATSPKYQHIDTAGPLRLMESNGFRIHGVDVAGSRDGSGREGYQKHMIRLRLPGVPDVAPGTTPEICFRNGHDGCSAYALFVGMFRGFCWNGIVIGSIWGAFKVSHIGHDVPGKVLAATTQVVTAFGTLRDVVANWQGIELSPLEQLEFANEAQQLRYEPDPETGLLPFAPAAMNAARREADVGNSLWLTYNRVQESVIAGGIYSSRRTASGRRVGKARGLTAIDSNVRVNQRLFSLAESFAANKATPNVADRAAFHRGELIEA